MKLERFYIGDYRVLENLDLDFQRLEERPSFLGEVDPKYALDFLVGVNGTGKSTVLRLLGRLFGLLHWRDFNYEFPVTVELAYTLQTQTNEPLKIIISNKLEEEAGDRHHGGRLRFKAFNPEEQDATDVTWIGEGSIRADWLPKVVIYTTGSETEWDAILNDDATRAPSLAPPLAERDEDELYLHELPGHQPDMDLLEESEADGDEEPDNYLFIRKDRLPLVALCGLLAAQWAEGQANTLNSVFESVGLSQFSGFSLRVRVHQHLTPPRQKDAVDLISTAATRIVRQGADQLLVFDMAQRPLLRSGTREPVYSSPIELFQRLYDLYEHRPYYDPPLQEVNIFLRRQMNDQARTEDNQPMLHLFDWLSDGEQSFLGRMALFSLFREDNLLILLDEPEVHFNDVWKREVVNMLDTIMQNRSSHALITTHSSIALTDVPPDDILVMQYENGRDLVAKRPRLKTFGADPGDIMVHVFGAPQATGARSVRDIRALLRQVNQSEDEIERRRLRLQNALRDVAPGYWSYRIRRELMRLAQ